MGWNLEEFATNVGKELVPTLGISYFISWGFFFLTLPFFVLTFGRVKGTAINYIVSWAFMIGVAWMIEKYDVVNKMKSYFS